VAVHTIASYHSTRSNAFEPGWAIPANCYTILDTKPPTSLGQKASKPCLAFASNLCRRWRSGPLLDDVEARVRQLTPTTLVCAKKRDLKLENLLKIQEIVRVQQYVAEVSEPVGVYSPVVG
jgi:hypothetical protein